MVYRRRRAPKTRVRRSYPRFTRARRRARGILGGMRLNWKSLAVGTAGLVVAQRFQPFGGAYKPAIDKIAVGAIASMAKMDNMDLVTAGIKEGVATLVNQALQGGISFGSVGATGGSL